ncbi:hypothetical protein DPMN_091413 [Dreissena polymorpha]|uniref:Uncharacterized protein n=1 Tax=Dreissena polymorpha TaxID=45954 RepID=A0A9D4QZY3_DREPO|nr:hypothetical protein DPMN_091413 [Dreissena polymorpha]
MAYEDNGSVEGRRYQFLNVLRKPFWGSSRQPVAIQAAERASSGKIFLSFQHSLCGVTLSF